MFRKPVERICGGYGFILASDKKCLSRRKIRHVPRGSTVQRAPDCSPRIRIEVLNYWGCLFCLIKFMGNYTLLAFWSLRSPIFCILCIMFVSLCLVNDDLHPVVCIDPRFVPWFFLSWSIMLAILSYVNAPDLSCTQRSTQLWSIYVLWSIMASLIYRGDCLLCFTAFAYMLRWDVNIFSFSIDFFSNFQWMIILLF